MNPQTSFSIFSRSCLTLSSNNYCINILTSINRCWQVLYSLLWGIINLLLPQLLVIEVLCFFSLQTFLPDPDPHSWYADPNPFSPQCQSAFLIPAKECRWSMGNRIQIPGNHSSKITSGRQLNRYGIPIDSLIKQTKYHTTIRYSRKIPYGIQ